MVTVNKWLKDLKVKLGTLLSCKPENRNLSKLTYQDDDPEAVTNKN